MRKIILFVLTMSIFLCRPSTVLADSLPKEFMSLDELRVILRNGPVDAFFMSTPEGTDPKKYKIKIKDIYNEPGLEIVMFFTKDKIAAGMSGSPVMVKGKLIGALAYGFNDFAKISWGGISPITRMYEDQKSSSYFGETAKEQTRRPFYYEGKLFTPIALGDKNVPASLIAEAEKISPSLADILKKEKLVMHTSQTTAGLDKNDSLKTLKAGMPIKVDLFEWKDNTGKITSLGAVGTVTYIDEETGRIYVFGHPFLGAKNVRYAFKACRIIGTILSEYESFKLSGESSEILGLIDFDSDYGIYGQLSLKELDKLHNFNLEFKKQGKSYNNFSVRIADHYALVPIIASFALGTIGDIYNAPLPNEPSVTELTVKLRLKSYQDLESKLTALSESFVFGNGVLYSSSYNIAIKKFISEVYSPIFFSNYKFKISDVQLNADFTLGKPKELKRVICKFPAKIVFGEDPVLEILLVSEDNSIALEKRTRIRVDWNKVEEPIYTKDAKETKKENEKIVNGLMAVFGATSMRRQLSEGEKQALFPDYFLGPEDFLKSFSDKLNLIDHGLFGKLSMQARSSLADEKVTSAESIVSDQAVEDKEGWNVVNGGVKTRKNSIKRESFVSLQIQFPPVEKGYVVNPEIMEKLFFEIVLKNDLQP